ncbi:hypothetical protein L1987_30776 [Smallanthus sonchifolius]|uniref:Uncharacterized protein n=1 Tax=Smallanthus sonchifolius TaxID=185202 RepID=A0ACB9I529_9ASTR|nr:hypothetical protein L1987_30776 [Smallanthus sonchifolius]
MAFRVPTVDASVVDLTVNLSTGQMARLGCAFTLTRVSLLGISFLVTSNISTSRLEMQSLLHKLTHWVGNSRKQWKQNKSSQGLYKRKRNMK